MKDFFKNILIQTIPFHDEKINYLKIILNFHMYKNFNKKEFYIMMKLLKHICYNMQIESCLKMNFLNYFGRNIHIYT